MTTKTENSTHSAVTNLEAPRYEHGQALLVAGLRSRYVDSTMGTLSSQWLRFSAFIGKVPGQVGPETYGLNFIGKASPGIEYLTGVQVASCTDLPAGFVCATIPAQEYAVFVHRGHVSTIHDTCAAIETQWLAQWGSPMARGNDVPDFFERYTKDFNPQTGMGGIEIWVPIQ